MGLTNWKKRLSQKELLQKLEKEYHPDLKDLLKELPGELDDLRESVLETLENRKRKPK